MKKNIDELLKSIRKERILIEKLVESDERDDSLFFNSYKSVYKELSSITDILIDELRSKYSYEEIREYLTNSLQDIENLDVDEVTLFGLINTKCFEEESDNIGFPESSYFTHEYNTNIYELYLWSIKNDKIKDINKEDYRYQLVANMADSTIMRKYFSGNIDEVVDMSSSLALNIDNYQEVKKMYYSLIVDLIKFSNGTEMFEGLDNDDTFNSKKAFLKLQYGALGLAMERKKLRFLILSGEVSDFTEEIVSESSEFLDSYLESRKDKKLEKTINL